MLHGRTPAGDSLSRPGVPPRAKTWQGMFVVGRPRTNEASYCRQRRGSGAIHQWRFTFTRGLLNTHLVLVRRPCQFDDIGHVGTGSFCTASRRQEILFLAPAFRRGQKRGRGDRHQRGFTFTRGLLNTQIVLVRDRDSSMILATLEQEVSARQDAGRRFFFSPRRPAAGKSVVAVPYISGVYDHAWSSKHANSLG